MEAVRYHEGGDADVLQFDDIERPEPTSDEILVEIEAASVNPVDAKRRQGGAGTLPKTTGSDFAGTVAAVGSNIDSFDVGDRVFGTGLHADRFQHGSFAEYVSVPLDIVAELPDSISFEQGAATALVGVTAWRGLIDHANLDPAETCLIHAGTGGVGHVAVQLADIVGASVVTTAGSQSAQETAASLGADVVLPYTHDDLQGAISEACDGGVDVVFDHRFDDYAQLDAAVASFGGRIVVYSGDGTAFGGGLFRSKELTTHWMSMSNLANREGTLPPIADILDSIATLMVEEGFSAKIADVYQSDEAVDIHRDVLNESFVGKLVYVP